MRIGIFRRRPEAPDAHGRGRSLDSLEGLSVGDALGERFFGHPDRVVPLIERRELPPGPWNWTDDTLMSCSIVELLLRGELGEARLFDSFRNRYDPGRGYGGAMHELLGSGLHLDHRAAASLFGGSGSWGNGAAMRVAPVGAYHAGDLAAAVEAAERSARTTHTHLEGRAGAVAVSVAAAHAARSRGGPAPAARDLLVSVAEAVPGTRVAEGLLRAAELPAGTDGFAAAGVLGSGSEVAAFDTAPFAVWAAAGNLDDYEEAFWSAVSGLGDRDTTCAIVGGIVAARVGTEGIPPEWRRRREPLPAWLEPGPRSS